MMIIDAKITQVKSSIVVTQVLINATTSSTWSISRSIPQGHVMNQED